MRFPLSPSSATLAITLLGLAACGDEPLVAPTADPTPAALLVDAGAPDAEATDAGASVPFVSVTVRRGQTLWDIAQTYDVDMRELRRFNRLGPYAAKHLVPGQVVRVPGVEEIVTEPAPEADDAGVPEVAVIDAGVPDAPLDIDAGTTGAPVEGAYHTLGEGETLWDLARTYDRTVDDILRANEWSDGDARGLRAGARVLVPGVTERQIRTQGPGPRGGSARRWGMRYRVERGETVWMIARRYNVSIAELMQANGLTPQQVQQLSAGQYLILPGVAGSTRAQAPSARPLTPTQERAIRLARRLGLGHRGAAQALLHGQVNRRWVAAAGGRPGQLPGTLRWPVANGRFVRGYGSGQGGYHLATDIAGDLGWNVRASAPGIVGYSGNELSGFGNVVFVIHAGGWVTLYGHNSVNFVVAGQRVRAGAILAEVGATGNAQGPHVHFELIYAGNNCDPSGLFRPGIRHRNRLARIPPVAWTAPGERPAAVQCAPRRRHPRNDLVENE